MKRWMALTGIFILGVAAMVVTELRKVNVGASPAALLNFVADGERDLTRMPMQFTRMPDEEEIRIGNELANSYSERQGTGKPPEEDVLVSDDLTRVGEQVASHAHRKLPYKFHYVAQQGMVNAFAVPGGHVFIGAGLLALMDSEDELAAVLGHEIEHIDHYHCAERVQWERAMRQIPLGGLISLPMQVFEAGYTKDQELEADREGTRLAVESGYSANGALRMFEAFAKLFQEYRTAAKTPQDEAAQVAQQTLEGYFRSHPLPSERIAEIQKLIASERWNVPAERDLRVQFIFRTAKARDALRAGKYKHAEELANQSLRLRAEQPKALDLLALAQFKQANFSGAAETFRKILQIEPSNAEVITSFARALAAANPKSAASEFQRWEAGVTGAKPPEVNVAAAGLALLNGKGESAQRLESTLQQGGSAQAAEQLGELGWWHYRADDYPRAVELLALAVQRIPDAGKLRLRLAWAEIEVRRYSDALRMLDSVAYAPGTGPEKMMACAVARWRAEEKDNAMEDFAGAFDGAKAEWENSRLIKALYSPMTAQSIAEMNEETERRREKAKADAAEEALRNKG
jgi:beta-barrel assembly-enhancing protease